MENPNSIENATLWELSCLVETIAYKLNSIRDVVDIIAERLVSSPESGATWAVSEMLEVQEKQLEAIAEELMNLHRETHKLAKKDKKK